MRVTLITALCIYALFLNFIPHNALIFGAVILAWAVIAWVIARATVCIVRVILE